MGGSAFGSRCGPRLTKAEYDDVKAKAEGTLRQLFSAVCTPPVDPEKQDFGDVDFIVFGHLNEGEQDDANLAAALNAVDHKSSGAILQVLVSLECAAETPRFAQVDVKRCADLAVFDMSVFLDSYSKLGEPRRCCGCMTIHAQCRPYSRELALHRWVTTYFKRVEHWRSEVWLSSLFTHARSARSDASPEPSPRAIQIRLHFSRSPLRVARASQDWRHTAR